jgi:hypothetical protein
MLQAVVLLLLLSMRLGTSASMGTGPAAAAAAAQQQAVQQRSTCQLLCQQQQQQGLRGLARVLMGLWQGRSALRVKMRSLLVRCCMTCTLQISI